MRDPFTFDYSQVVRSGARTDKYGIDLVDLLYTLPGGDQIGITVEARDLRSTTRGRAALEEGFAKIVAGLSAHQRLAWMAAAQKESADA